VTNASTLISPPVPGRSLQSSPIVAVRARFIIAWKSHNVWSPSKKKIAIRPSKQTRASGRNYVAECPGEGSFTGALFQQ
jgi:hypothetical protein